MGKLIQFSDLVVKKKAIAKKKSSSVKKINVKSFSILKVTLSDWNGRTKGNPFRVISIPSSLKLEKLAFAILDSFDFDCDHMFGFYDNLKKWTDANESYVLSVDDTGEATGFVEKVTIKEAFEIPKKKMLFLFDYGDEWRFVVELVKEIPWDGKSKLTAKIIESKGEPPEQYPDFEA